MSKMEDYYHPTFEYLNKTIIIKILRLIIEKLNLKHKEISDYTTKNTLYPGLNRQFAG
jgi:hypothetical protein